jgi:hypothetical protein
VFGPGFPSTGQALNENDPTNEPGRFSGGLGGLSAAPANVGDQYKIEATDGVTPSVANRVLKVFSMPSTTTTVTLNLANTSLVEINWTDLSTSITNLRNRVSVHIEIPSTSGPGTRVYENWRLPLGTITHSVPVDQITGYTSAASGTTYQVSVEYHDIYGNASRTSVRFNKP